MRGETRTPYYLGSGGRRLFGCLHDPAGRTRRSRGIVLCYPFGQEYVRAHRSFVQLAARLASKGYPVLRFDYHGTGDSAGDLEDATVAGWVRDIDRAADDLRERAGTTRLALVGCRLGGALCLQASAGLGEGDALVLWDPVLDGRSYVAELRALQQEMLRFEYVSGGAELDPRRGEEVLGFALPPPLREELESLDLRDTVPERARRVLLVATQQSKALADFRDRLASRGADVDSVTSDDKRVWLGEPMKSIVPHRLLESVVDWFDKLDR